MKVYLYSELQKTIEKSGIGRALYHQQRALALAGIQVVDTKEAADVIHINTVFPHSYLLARWAKRHQVPLVYHAHSTREDFKNSYIGSNLFANAFLFWLKQCYQLGTVIVTPTPYSKSLLQSYGIKQPIHAISNGIDLTYYQTQEGDKVTFRQQYGYTADDSIIMSAGAWIQRKGILTFIQLAKQFPQYKFIWFGESNLNTIPHHIRHEITHAPDNLIFAGYVNQDQLKQAYASCDLFLFPSHEETEGIVVLEALAMKIPVLVRDIPVYDPWLEDGVNCYKAQRDADFSRLLSLIIEGDLPDLTEQGFSVAQARDLRLVGDALARTYQEAIQLKREEAK